jgi:hypothetical protein
MHLHTHLLAGWVLGNLPPFSPRERLFCMLVSIVPDLDGLGILWGADAYVTYHHLLTHNLLAAAGFSLLFALFSRRRTVAFFVYLVLFHLHLLMDYFGSGPGWPIAYGWPFFRREFVSEHAWSFNGWQNIVTMVVFLWWGFWLLKTKKRTPFERIWPALDRKLVRKAET